MKCRESELRLALLFGKKRQEELESMRLKDGPWPMAHEEGTIRLEWALMYSSLAEGKKMY